MPRFFLELSYDGTDYHGWQVQPNAITVQAEIEQSLAILLKAEVPTVGCGRTDTGVHAKQFYLHFDCSDELPFPPEVFVYKLNRLLSPAISILKATRTNGELHARFSAISRTYRYFIHRHKSPFLARSWEVHQSLNLDLMRECGEELRKYKDFTSFSKLHTDTKTNDCDLLGFEIFKEGEQLIIEISANRFLRNMVRAIVGTLVDVGKGKLSKVDFLEIVSGKNRSLASASAPAKGLFLWEVLYPEVIE